MSSLSCVEICAGAGGQALGLEHAGFDAQALVEIDDRCCETLRANRPEWNVIERDVKHFDGKPFQGVELLARIQVRRAKGGDQIELLKWLIGKFPQKAKELLDS